MQDHQCMTPVWKPINPTNPSVHDGCSDPQDGARAGDHDLGGAQVGALAAAQLLTHPLRLGARPVPRLRPASAAPK